MTKWTDMAHTFGVTGKPIKANGRKTDSMVVGSSIGPMGPISKVSMKMMRETVREPWFGAKCKGTVEIGHLV
jgi:hypothetical protein